ncbi:MFS transporter, partial [Petrachloros mirabilis]
MTTSRSFTLLCTIGVFCFISYNMVRMPVLALFAESLGAGPERIGLIVSVSTLTGVFLKLPSGALSDIYGRRMLLRVGVIAFGLPPFIYPFVSDLNLLTVLRMFHGLATAIFAPSALATVAELYRERRGAALGTYTAATQSGALLGPFIGGYLAYAAGFPSAFVTAGLFGCLAIVIFYSLHLTPPPPRVHEKGLAPVLSEMWKGFAIVARNRKVLITSSTDAAKMIANGALMAFLPLYGVSVGLNPGEVGLLFTVQALTSFFSKPIMGRVSDQVGRQPLIMTGLLICAGTFVLIPHVSVFAVLLLLSAGFGFGEAVVSSSSS